MNTMFPSQSFTKHINLVATTRLPISPPPEEEIRSKDAAMRGSPFKQSQAHFSVGCQPSSSMFIELSDRNLGMNQLTFAKNVQNTSASVSRKRGRSAHVSPLADSSNMPSNGTSADPSPNPKPRKQVKIHSSASFKGDAISSRKMRRNSVAGHDRSNMGSPRGKRTDTGTQDYVPGRENAENSDVICLQKKGKSKSRRSLTPSVPYEPPVEQFTPPRSVVRSGIVSPAPFMTRWDKSMSPGFKRKQSLEPKVVKIERLTSPFPLPPLDLSRPVPPPSPTDDPLLLMGEHATFSPSDISMNDPVKENPFPDRNTASYASPSQYETNPSTPFMIADSPSSNGISEVLNAPRSNISRSLEIYGGTAHPRLSHSPGTTEYDVFSSDNEETEDESGEAEGEFTGRFKFYKTPIKDDPPSSATKMRRESWGRPISPFPRKPLFSFPSDEEHEGENDVSHQEESPPSPSDGRGKHASSHPDSLLRRYVSDKGDMDLGGHFVAALEMQQSGASDLGRSLANTFSNESPSRSCIIEGDFDGSSSDGELDSRIVEVSSSDPRAAARAAAILKLHHSYVVGDVNVKTGSLPSTHIMHQKCIPLDPANADDGGSPEGLVQRSCQQHLLISENPVPCYGIAEQTHGDLATQEEEAKIPLRFMSVPASETSYSQLSQGTVIGWTKSHWKKLDVCFTDERYAVAAAMGLPGRMADVSDVQIEAVVARFINEMEEGGGWDRVALIRRVTALVARQRSGKGAPPSPSLLTLVNSHSFQTKVSRQSGRTQLELNAHSHIPLSLRAPRYAHLLEEAVSSPPVSDTPPVTHSTQSNLQVVEDNTRLQTDPGSPTVSHMSTKPALVDQPPSIPTSTTKRALNYLGSLLGRSNGSNAAKRTISYSPVPALPMPHVNQIQRAPVTTPAKRSIPKIQPPKELVRLTEMKPTNKEQVLPKSKCAKDLVKLKHVEPLTSVRRPRFEPITVPLREKRSVKDLVRKFEVMEQTNSHSAHTRDIRKVSSMGNLNTKPVWRP